MPPVGYIAYIDESGDDGIKRVRPIDPGGASEWFVLSALVIEARHESQVPKWHSDILAISGQRRDIHFNRMTEAHRLHACEYIAETEARIFAAVSWKPTMRGYRNQKAEKVGGKNVFYNFMARVLLEKVSNYCLQHSLQRQRRQRSYDWNFRVVCVHPCDLRASALHLRFEFVKTNVGTEMRAVRPHPSCYVRRPWSALRGPSPPSAGEVNAVCRQPRRGTDRDEALLFVSG